MSKNDIGIVHVSKCSGISKFLDESMYAEMCERLDDEQLENYKRNVEKYYRKLNVRLPWDND